MQLAVDIGNSRVKAGLFDGTELVQAKSELSLERLDLKRMLEQFEVQAVISSSVGEEAAEQIRESVESIYYLELGKETKMPIQSLYSSPGTLGNDRRALAVAAHQHYPDTNVLVIDIGTCITFDFVDDKGRYHGGSISPGVDMRFQSMHNFTSSLPLVDLKEPVKYVGDDTESALKAGVFQGMLHEIDGVISVYKNDYPALKTMLTGGDSSLFESQLKSEIFVVQNLVLHGLNQILIYNVNQKK